MTTEQRTEYEAAVEAVVNAYLADHEVTPDEMPAIVARAERAVGERLRRRWTAN